MNPNTSRCGCSEAGFQRSKQAIVSTNEKSFMVKEHTFNDISKKGRSCLVSRGCKIKMNATAADFAAFFAVMFGMILIGYLFGLLLRGLTKVLMLGWLDRFGGMILGCLTALLVLILSLSSIAVFPAVEWLAKDVESSLLANNLLGSVSLIDQLLPSEFQDPQAQLTSWREAISQLSTKDTNKKNKFGYPIGGGLV